MNSHLDDVNELLKRGVGDRFRLEHLKKTLEANRILYISDRKYLEELVKEHLTDFEGKKLSKFNKYDYPEYQNKVQISTPEPKPTPEPQPTPTNSENIKIEINNSFCGNCGNRIHNENFCPKCGSPQNKSQSDSQLIKNQQTVTQTGIKSFQVLSIIGGVLGLIASLLYAVTASFFDSVASAFGSGLGSEFYEYYNVAMPLSIIIYISCFIIPFVIKKPKIVGVYLIMSSLVVIIATSYVGILGFALLLPAGIIALRQKQ